MATKTTSRLDPRAVARVSGPTWAPLKATVLAVADALLAVPSKVSNELTTIYVKFARRDGSVYAVMWIKSAVKGVIVGLSLPFDVDSSSLHGAPQGLYYPGLTKYFTLQAGEAVPSDLSTWALAAFENS